MTNNINTNGALTIFKSDNWKMDWLLFKY